MFELRKLPFEVSAFSRLITQEVIDFHYGRHHATYVKNLNDLTKEGEFAGKSLFDIIQNSSGGLFNNAAQVFNHDFYWDCLSPKETCMGEAIKKGIESQFGSTESFLELFIKSGAGQFGSGWVWLVYDNNRLEIMSTSNADTPIRHNKIPVLVCDVWEHAYYINHRNDRMGYLQQFVSQINWEFVEECYTKAKIKGMNAIRDYTESLHKG